MQKLSYRWETLKSSTNRTFTIIFNTDDTRGATSLFQFFFRFSIFMSQGLFSTNSCQLLFLKWLAKLTWKHFNKKIVQPFKCLLQYAYSYCVQIYQFFKSYHCPTVVVSFPPHQNNLTPNFVFFYQRLVHLVCMETTVSVNSLRWNETGYKIKGNKAR